MSPSGDQRHEEPPFGAATSSPPPATSSPPPGASSPPPGASFSAPGAQGTQAPPGFAAGRRPRVEHRAPAKAATQNRAVAALLLALLSLGGLLGLSELQRGTYVVLCALLAGALGLWLVITAIRRARRERTALPRGSVTAAVIAGSGVALNALLLVAFVVLGRQLSAYGSCLDGANTIATQQACQHQFTRSVAREFGFLRAGQAGQR